MYGTSRLYFDLVSLGENVLVKQESLRAATKLRQDDEDQVSMGTLAPIELTRAKALESSSKFDLIQAQGLYKQQEIILRNELLRTASPVFAAQFDEIVATDRIVVPEMEDPLDMSALAAQALVRRPDLAQAKLQIEAGKISVKRKPQCGATAAERVCERTDAGIHRAALRDAGNDRKWPGNYAAGPRAGRGAGVHYLSGRRAVDSATSQSRGRQRRGARHGAVAAGASADGDAFSTGT